MEKEKVLVDAGLAGNEAKVYLALLELGSATAGSITKASGVNRTNVYDALQRLSEKGLVGFVKKAERRYFEAASPYRLVGYLEEKENEIQKVKQNLEEAAPQLEGLRNLSRQPQEATIYQGAKGIKSVAEDVIRAGHELMVFGAEGSFMKLFGHYARNWHARRSKGRIRMKIIYSEKLRGDKSKEKLPLSDVRFSQNPHETPATTWIYGDKVAIIVWSAQPVATLIRSREVSESYVQFFSELWKASKPAIQTFKNHRQKDNI
jgi:sugar-specific transcriptional regulator TrmB